MLKNLLKTWAILAPDEVTFGQDHTCLLLRRNTEEHGLASIETSEPLLCYEQDSLQGYLQRCIQDKGWRSQLTIYPSGVEYSRVIDDEKDKVAYSSSETKGISLLTAYLKALAAQRTITPGKWQHFKGKQYTVIGSAEWESFKPQSNFDALTSPWQVEDAPSASVWLGGYMREPFHYYTSNDNKDYGELVFYKSGSENWARKSDNFLRLVGADHPEHEGLLRFVEVSNASPQ